MKRFLTAPTQLAFLMASVAIGALAYQGDTPAQSTAPRLKHAPVQVHRNDDGTLKRGRNAEILTSNWAGYAAAQFETGQIYTAAQGSWTVPTLTFEANDNDPRSLRTQYSATWVGIGGFCEDANCTIGDPTLIQLGTDQDVSSDNRTNYFSWYELLPNSPVIMNRKIFPVVPGDQITASLQCNAPCTDNTQSWTLSMTSTNASWPKRGWTVTLPYASSKLSAEWIEEAPSSRAGILPLANFGTVTIDPDLGAESAPALSLATNGILMEDPWGQTANVSDPDATGFNACWGFLAFTGCPAP
jgi:hypothetical protein